MLEVSPCRKWSRKYIPIGIGWVVAVDVSAEAVNKVFAVDEAVGVVDKVAVDKAVEDSTVDKVAVVE